MTTFSTSARRARTGSHVRAWDIIEPLDWATGITSGRSMLDAQPRQLEQLPEYRRDNELIPDNALERDVERVLKRDERLQVQDVRVVAVLGLVRLEGHVATPDQRALAAQITRHVPGVQAVNNALKVDSPARTPTVQVEDPSPIRE